MWKMLLTAGVLASVSLNSFGGNWNSASAFQEVLLDFGVEVEEVYFLDSLDVNNDGYDDFVISGLVDVQSQIGVGCCNVPPELVPKIKKLTPLLLVSDGAGNYKQIAFPREARTIRTWAGSFFEHGTNIYFYLGRNGEVSDPIDGNKGETGLLYKLNSNPDGFVSFHLVEETNEPTTTASISIINNRGNWYVVENNYLDFSYKEPWARSRLFRFTGSSLEEPQFKLTGFNPNQANNHLRIADLDGDSQLEILVSAEVIFDFGSGLKKQDFAGSYVLSSPVENPRIQYLPDPYFGDSHAGFHTEIVRIEDQTFVVEIGVELNTRNQFGKPMVSVYEYTKSGELVLIKVKGSELFDIQKFMMSNTQVIDLNGDGKLEVLLQSYSTTPLYVDFTNLPALKRLSQSLALKPSSGKGRVLALQTINCIKLASLEDWKRSRYPRLMLSKQCVTGNSM